MNEKTSFGKNIGKFLYSNPFFNKNLREELRKNKEDIITKNKLLEELGEQITEPSLIASDARKLTDIMNEMSSRIDLKNFKSLYLRNQFIFRGINKRASEVVSRGYDIVGEDKVGVKKCSELIKNSGGASFLRQSHINADVFGDCYWEHIYNKGGKEIKLLRQIHPLIFGFKRNPETNTIIFGPDKTPIGYEQKVTDPYTGFEQNIDVPKDKITHIKFNVFGDELSGISILQPVYDTVLRLMNMEKAAAVAAVRTANPLIVVKTSAKSPSILARWMKAIGNITGRQQVLLGENQELDLKPPGNQNFNEYAEYYLDALVSDLEVPKAILLGSGGSNRAETITLSKDFFRTMRDHQLIVERDVDKIFEKYGKMAGFKPPKFVFIDVAESAEALAEQAVSLYTAGIISTKEAREMIGITGAGGKRLVSAGTQKEIKKSDAKSWHPTGPKSPEGSQAREKKKMKRSPDSETPSIK